MHGTAVVWRGGQLDGIGGGGNILASSSYVPKQENCFWVFFFLEAIHVSWKEIVRSGACRDAIMKLLLLLLTDWARAFDRCQ